MTACCVCHYGPKFHPPRGQTHIHKYRHTETIDRKLLRLLHPAQQGQIASWITRKQRTIQAWDGKFNG